jgi:hypothetical protein
MRQLNLPLQIEAVLAAVFDQRNRLPLIVLQPANQNSIFGGNK